MDHFHHIIENEIIRYVDIKDRNTLLLLDKKFYRNLRFTTPSLRDIKQKKQVNTAISNILSPLRAELDRKGAKLDQMRISKFYLHHLDDSSMWEEDEDGTRYPIPFWEYRSRAGKITLIPYHGARDPEVLWYCEYK